MKSVNQIRKEGKEDKTQDEAAAKPKFIQPIKPLSAPAGLANVKPTSSKKPNTFHSSNKVGKKSGDR